MHAGFGEAARDAEDGLSRCETRYAAAWHRM